MQTVTSHQLQQRALQVIPGGVNSPVRAFGGVGGEPRYMASAEGAWLTDVDGNRYIDYVGSWGPAILGHAAGPVVAAVQQAAARGLSFGTPTEAEAVLAEVLCELVPSMQQVRLVNSGTEATMSALRLARGFTGRDLVVKFEGCYHGHVDSLLVKAGSGALTHGAPSSPGIPAASAALTLTLPYNDLAAAQALFAERGNQIAALIVEPVAGNMGCVPPRPEFLPGLRSLCNASGSLLIFDEVMTGFRVHIGGAQALYGVTPDLTTLGKIIGGGLPVGAFGGRSEIMQALSPVGDVYQAGTLSGNPLATAAGLATLEQLRKPGFYAALEASSAQLARGLEDAAATAGVPITVNRVASMLGIFFTGDEEVTCFAAVQRADAQAYAHFFHQMLDQGIYLAPSAYETLFVSAAHGEQELRQTLSAASVALHSLAGARQ